MYVAQGYRAIAVERSRVPQARCVCTTPEPCELRGHSFRPAVMGTRSDAASPVNKFVLSLLRSQVMTDRSQG